MQIVFDEQLDELLNFISKTHETSGPILVNNVMDKFSQRTIDLIHEEHTYHQIVDVIDIGCGVGKDLKLFRDNHQKIVTGVTISPTDAAKLREEGFNIIESDQNFLPPELNGKFDLVWSRHCLEHSIMPFYTLYKYHKLLRLNGLCYLEVPDANALIKHECNPNHYSVMGQLQLKELILRAGFVIVQSWDMDFDYGRGDGTEVAADKWCCYLLRKIERVC